MPERNLYVTFTMDCERIAEHAPEGGGPKSWQISEEAIRRFAEVLNQQGLKGGFYIQPETAERHKETFLKLRDQSFDLGIQFHPGNLRDLNFKRYLGSYSKEEQIEVIKIAKEDWEKAFGFSPKTFRAGHGSANDYTYPIIYELGFRQSSMCFPGRNLPNIYAVWVNAYPYPHHVDPNNRLIQGNLELYEIPITVSRKVKADFPLDLRVEAGCSLEDHRETVESNVREMLQLKLPVKAIVALTHNTERFLEHVNVLKFIAKTMKEVAENHNLKIVPATLEQIHEAAHGRFP